MPGRVMVRWAAMPKPAGMGPMPTLAWMVALAGMAILAAPATLQRADEAGRVAGGEQLLGVGGAAGTAEFLGRAELHVQQAVGGRRGRRGRRWR
jgi:hypothetical protein